MGGSLSCACYDPKAKVESLRSEPPQSRRRTEGEGKGAKKKPSTVEHVVPSSSPGGGRRSRKRTSTTVFAFEEVESGFQEEQEEQERPRPPEEEELGKKGGAEEEPARTESSSSAESVEDEGEGGGERQEGKEQGEVDHRDDGDEVSSTLMDSSPAASFTRPVAVELVIELAGVDVSARIRQFEDATKPPQPPTPVTPSEQGVGKLALRLLSALVLVAVVATSASSSSKCTTGTVVPSGKRGRAGWLKPLRRLLAPLWSTSRPPTKALNAPQGVVVAKRGEVMRTNEVLLFPSSVS